MIDGQDANILRYLERFGEEPPVPSRAHDDTPEIRDGMCRAEPGRPTCAVGSEPWR